MSELMKNTKNGIELMRKVQSLYFSNIDTFDNLNTLAYFDNFNTFDNFKMFTMPRDLKKSVSQILGSQKMSQSFQ